MRYVWKLIDNFDDKESAEAYLKLILTFRQGETNSYRIRQVGSEYWIEKRKRYA